MSNRFEQHSKAGLIALVERLEDRVREEQTKNKSQRLEDRTHYGKEADILARFREQPAWKRAWRALRGQL